MAVKDKQDIALKALLEVTQAINANLSEEQLYRIYQFTLQGYLHFSKAALYAWESPQECLRKIPQSQRSQLPTTIDEQSRQILSTIQHPMRLSQTQLPSIFKVYDWIVPVIHQGKALAHVFLSTYGDEEIDLEFVQTLSNIVLVAIENKRLVRKQIEQEALQRELALAQRVQRMLLPAQIAHQDKFDLAVFYQPHRNVGGDFYDVIRISQEEVLLCIADVSGKGIGAALMMANFQASLRAIVKNTHHLPDIIHQLNELIYENTQGENFITVFLAHYHFGKKQMSYINAGHHPPFLYSAGRPIQQLSRGSTVLGCFCPLPFLEISTIEKVEKALLLAYTDGLAEIHNAQSEQYGIEKLEQFIQRNHHLPVHEFIQSLLNDLNTFCQEVQPHDDCTILCCRFF
jgi:sigma-B regulation protein RsbU (phosphoserine phosphatase)